MIAKWHERLAEENEVVEDEVDKDVDVVSVDKVKPVIPTPKK